MRQKNAQMMLARDNDDEASNFLVKIDDMYLLFIKFDEILQANR